MARRTTRTYPNLRAYFDESGDNQTRFGARIGRSQSWVSRVVNGEIEPGLADALAISRLACVPLESLIASASMSAVSE